MKQTELQDFFGSSPFTLVPKVAEKPYCPDSGLSTIDISSPTIGTLDRNPWGVFNPDLVPYTSSNTSYIDKPEAKPTKHDSGKADWSLMPFEVVEEINKVLEFGANKYNEKGISGPESWNWAKGSGLGKWRVLNAVFRHLFAYARGQELDSESGLPHISHAACGLIFLIYYGIYPNKYAENK